MNKKNEGGLTQEEFERGKSYVGLLVKYRPRTEQEVINRLREKNFDAEAIEELVDWAKKQDLIDDSLFAKFWIEDRLAKKPKGRSGLYKELLDHGVERSTAKEVLQEIISDEKEERMLRELAEKRLNRYEGEDVKAKYRKTSSFLIRRGFSKGAVHNLLKDLLFDRND